MNDEITDIASLESCVGKAPGAVNLKVIDYLDEGAARWIASSPLLFAAFGGGGGLVITAGGGEPGFARAIDAKSLIG
jgi:uncharacterized protein